MSDHPTQRLLRSDSRTTKVATHESLALPASGAKALLRTLRADEKVLALYHQGLGHAALTGSALVLLGPGPAPRVTRVPRPLAILRPAHGARRLVDVSVEGRSIGLWGSRLDASGQLLVQAGEPVPDPLAEDSRTAQVAAGESIALSDAHKKALLEALERGEVVRALYRDGWGHAALTGNGLVLLRNPWAPKATRVPRPLRILRPTYGLFDAVDLVVDGKPHKLNGSKLDPRGELLQATGELLPPESPVRPGRGTWIATWIRRHPVLMSTCVALMFFGGTASDTSGGEASAQVRADRTLTVPDFTGASLSSAVSKADAQAWRTVSAMDASSAFRPLAPTAQGWRVCFQLPGHQETVRPSARMLTLYAVPDREECPTRLLGPRRVLMPDLVGERFDDASRALDALGLDHVTPFHAHTGRRLEDTSRDLAGWQVCRQQPEPDAEVDDYSQVDLWLIAADEPCTQPSPKPKPKPKPKPAPKPQPSYGTSSGGSTGGSGTSGSSTGGSSSGSSGGTTGGTSSGGSGTSGGSTGSGSSTGGAAGVQFGQYCSPVGSTATTADGRPAKCFMGKDGQPRWGYNSG